MKIIIIGMGKIGCEIAKTLHDEGHDIVVIDKDPEKVEQITDCIDILGIEGNGATLEILNEAGIDQADLVIAATAADELNLYACFVAKCAGVKNTIARVRNPEYAQDMAMIKNDLGLSLIINPELTSAREIKRLMHFTAAMEIDSFAKGFIELYVINIPKTSILSDKKISDLSNIFKNNTRICTVQRGNDIFIPNGDFILKANDRISMVTHPNEAGKLFKRLGIASAKTKNVIIVGGGKIAFYLSKLLIKSGVRVKIIEKSLERCKQLSEALPEAIIIQGDGMDQQLLLTEDITHADGFVSLMDIDEENILLSLYVKSVSKAKVITKINRISFNDLIESLDLGSVIQPKKLTSEYILRYVRAMQNSLGSNIETLYKIMGGKAEALEFIVKANSPVAGVPIKDLKFKEELQISCINRNGKIIIPDGNDIINIGDTVIVVTKKNNFKDLKDILK